MRPCQSSVDLAEALLLQSFHFVTRGETFISAPKVNMSSNDSQTPAFAGGIAVLDRPFRFIKPTIPPLDRVLGVYRKAYESGVLTNSDIVARFESAVAERLGVSHCIAISSCTSGLMLVLRALDLRGEVILPSFTFFASGHAAVWNGLTPVFADIDGRSWNVDPASVEALITPRTCAIVGVHMYGNPCSVGRLCEIAARHRLKLVFDAAHAFGSRYGGSPIGQFGDAEVFSLSPTKLLVAGEGGIVATNDAILAHRIRAGRNYGDLGAYDPELMGLNARMTEFNAALGLAGLALVDLKISRHNEIARAYTEMFSSVPGLSFQHVRNGDTHTYKDYSVVVDPAAFGMNRDELVEALRAENIETKKYFYPPLHKQSLYRTYYDSSRQNLEQTNAVSGAILSLPVYESLADETLIRIGKAISRIANYQRLLVHSTGS
jgi:dTDP-4-amino-4,6-dideoxygalactose transaminase